MVGEMTPKILVAIEPTRALQAFSQEIHDLALRRLLVDLRAVVIVERPMG
jgi:hypothetical protein